MLVLAASSAVIIALVIVWALRQPNDTPQATDPADGLPQADSPAATEPIPAEPAIALPALAEEPPATAPSSDEPIPSPQAEAAALKREAVEVAGQLAADYPDDAVSYALLGSAHYNSGRSDEAVKWLKKCLQLDPDRADAYAMLAMVASEKGQLEQAVSLCNSALTKNSAMPGVYNRLGRALMDLGRTDELVRTMEQAVKMPGRSSESYYLLGQGYLQSKEYAKAKQRFRLAIGLLPDHTQAYFGLFTACTRLGQREEADQYRKRFQELELVDRKALSDRNVQEDTLSGLPKVRETVAKTYTGAAQIYYAHKDSSKAEALWRRAATLDPQNMLCRSALVALYRQQNRTADALKLFEQLAETQPESGMNHFQLGNIHARLGQFDAAERAYQKVAELAPHRAEGYRALAELYLRSDRKPSVAKTLVQKVVELKPSAPNYFLLGVACAANRDHAGALAAMGRAMELDPDNRQYRRFHERLEKER